LSNSGILSFFCVSVYWQEAESLIAKKIHPQTIISGWREATKAAREALLSSAVDHGLVYRNPVVGKSNLENREKHM
jgi:hypothetical protein